MRHSKMLLTVCAVLVFSVSTISGAGAFVSNTSGQLIFLPTAPLSVLPNALENSTSAVTFDEAQGVVLAAKLPVDIVDPATYTSFSAGSATIPAGTRVDSHLVHSDPTRKPYQLRRAGTITFPSDVLGVVVSPKALAATDFLGAAGTLYSGKRANRGLDLGQDSLTLEPDLRTISFDIKTNALDEFRVITAHANRLLTVISAATEPLQSGSNETYDVTVTNTGPVMEPDVHVTDTFPGAAFVSASAPGTCTPTLTDVTCGLGDLGPGDFATATVVVLSADLPVSGTLTNSATAPPGEDPVATHDTTLVSPVLDTTISDGPAPATAGPDPVTVSNDVKYVVTVTNNGIAPVAEAHVLDTLPDGTTLKSATAPGGCTVNDPVDCTLGPLAVGASLEADVIVTSPSQVPDGATITDTAVASPGNNTAASEDTTVVVSPPGEVRGYVAPGESIQIDGTDPATVTLPADGTGSPVVITQGTGTFCNGPCDGTTTTVSDIPDYVDPNVPIHITLTYNFPNHGDEHPTSLDEAQAVLLARFYKFDASDSSSTVVPPCTTTDIAIPHPCVNSRHLDEVPFHSGNYVVSIEIIYLSGDPSYGHK